MSSWKCHNCGLVNFAGIENCRRCQASATGGYTASPYGQGNSQVNRAPQQGDWQANPGAPLPNNQAGNLPSQYPQTSSGNFTQSNQDASNTGYQQNPYLHAQGGDHSSPSDIGNNNPSLQNPGYQQNDGYQQGSGYAYNRGDTNNPNTPSQPYAGYQQTDYSRAPAYGAPAVGGYQQSYQDGYGAQGQGVWQDGKKLVAHIHAQLPRRCVKCNAPTHGSHITRTLSWIHPGWFVLVIFGVIGWIIFAIISATLKKKAVMSLGLCEKHISARRTNITIGWAVVVAGILLIIGAIAMDTPVLIFVGILAFLVGVIVASMATAIVTVAKMDDQYIWMTRINPDYLANFPTTGGY